MARIYYESRRTPPYFKTNGATVGYDTMNNSINDCFVFENGKVVSHRTMLKIIINPLLRLLQFWTYTPYVIASEYGKCPINGYYFIKYRFMQVKYNEK